MDRYILHAEAKIGDKWRCIDGFLPHKMSRYQKPRLFLLTLFEAGEDFESAYEILKSIGNKEPFSGLSREVQFAHADHRFRKISGTDGYKEASFTVIDKKSFDEKLASDGWVELAEISEALKVTLNKYNGMKKDVPENIRIVLFKRSI